MAISNYNRHKVIDWNIDTTGYRYIKLNELDQNVVYNLYGLFTTPDSGYGVGAVLITDGVLVNIPQRYVETVESIRKDDEAVAQIKNGKAGFKYKTFKANNGGTGYDIEFVDL